MTLPPRGAQIDLRYFNSWLARTDQIPMEPETRLDLKGLASINGKSPDEFVGIVRRSFGSIDNHRPETLIVFAGDFGSLRDIDIFPDCKGTFIKALHFMYFRRVTITLRDFEVRELSFENCETSDIIMANLLVNKLALGSQSGNYKLEKCYIGTLSLSERSVHSFGTSGGAILNIDCPPPTHENPFTGSVQLDRRTYLPTKSGRLLRGAQPYRNLRTHMSKLENAPMVSRFHRLEQSVERENLALFDRLLSHGYRVLSDYGSSSLRPVACLVLLMLLTASLTYATDGAQLKQTNDLNGWESGLRGNGFWVQAERAFVLATQATLNPLGIFGRRGVLVAKFGWLATWLVLHGLLSTLFVALFIFAVRRRFKVT
jgi:hypothetical protein